MTRARCVLKRSERILKMLENGSGADRQLRVFRETGDLRQVVDYIISETEADVFTKPVSEAVATS